jgi:hypothetical protein
MAARLYTQEPVHPWRIVIDMDPELIVLVGRVVRAVRGGITTSTSTPTAQKASLMGVPADVGVVPDVVSRDDREQRWRRLGGSCYPARQTRGREPVGDLVVTPLILFAAREAFRVKRASAGISSLARPDASLAGCADCDFASLFSRSCAIREGIGSSLGNWSSRQPEQHRLAICFRANGRS